METRSSKKRSSTRTDGAIAITSVASLSSNNSNAATTATTTSFTRTPRRLLRSNDDENGIVSNLVNDSTNTSTSNSSSNIRNISRARTGGNNTNGTTKNESMEYEPPPIRISDLLDPSMNIFNAIGSDNHDDDEDDNDDDPTDTYQSRFHYNFPSELEEGIDYNYSSTINTVVTDEELKADEEFLQSLIAAREERERNYIVYTTEGQDKVAAAAGGGFCVKFKRCDWQRQLFCMIRNRNYPNRFHIHQYKYIFDTVVAIPLVVE